MSQDTVLSLLRRLRLSGDDRFFTKSEIAGLLNCNGLPFRNVPRQINKLVAWGYLERRGCFGSVAGFRIRKSCLNVMEDSRFVRMSEEEVLKFPSRKHI